MMEFQVVLVVIFDVVLLCGAHLCGERDLSCSHHLLENNLHVHIPQEACLVKYYPLNSPQCHSLEFTKNLSPQDDLGHIELFADVNETYRLTVINVLLKNIAWKRAKMKFSRIGVEHEKNMCRNFDIWGNLTLLVNSSLIYNCFWSFSDYEGHDYSFEYELGLPWDYHKYLFKVPIFEHLNNSTLVTSLEVFSYMEVSDPDYITLFIQSSKSVYNITGYAVEEFLEHDNRTKLLSELILETNQLTYSFSTSDKVGLYYFSIRPISSSCPNSECTRTLTPRVFIERPLDYTFFIICTGVIVLMFTLCLAWVCKRRRKGRKCNQILLVYNPKSKSHFNVVYRLSVVLKDVLNLKVLFDEVDIPQTTHKDPFKWCPEAFNGATDIIYIASPTSGNFKRNTKSVYRIDGIVNKYIRSELVNDDSKKQILVATFPYSERFTPAEFQNLKTFHLMKDINRLLSTLGLSSYRYLSFANLLKRSKLQNDERYRKLIRSVQKAEEEFRGLEEAIEEMPLLDVVLSEDVVVKEDVGDSDRKEEKGLEAETRKFDESDFANRLSNLDLSGNFSPEISVTVQIEAHKSFDNNINDLVL